MKKFYVAVLMVVFMSLTAKSEKILYTDLRGGKKKVGSMFFTERKRASKGTFSSHIPSASKHFQIF